MIDLGYWNSVPKQTIFGFGDDGKVGDCFRCCIAAILRVPANEVPHFVELAHNDSGGWSADIRASLWLGERGYRMLTSSPVGNLWFGEYRTSDWPLHTIPTILSGPTVRSKNEHQTHAVVKIDNFVYDPHPSESGLLATNSRRIILRDL